MVGGRIRWTLASYILLRFLHKNIALNPLNQPYIIYIETLSFSITYVLLKIQFGNSQERFDNLTNPAIVNVEGKSFSVCLSYPGGYYKVDFTCATLKIFLLNDRKQVFGCLS